MKFYCTLMARKKASQQKKDVASSASVLPNKNKRPNGSDANFRNEEDLIGKRSPEAMSDEHFVEAEIVSNHKTRKSPKREKQVMDAKVAGGQTVSDTDNSEKNTSTSEPTQSTEGGHTSSDIPLKGSFADSFNESLVINDTIENAELFARLVFRYLRSIALSLYKATSQWLERLEPTFASTKSVATNALDHVRVKIEHAYPIIVKWSMYIGKMMFLVMMVWLECTLRGLDSFLHLGTTSFFTVIWCSVLSIVAMIGVFKFLMAMAIIAVVGLFMGFALGILLIVIAGITLTYFYGSFWITLLVVLSGGSAFLLKRDRLALFIATSYSMYCAWGYVGLLGLFFGLNLSFISSEALIFLLRDNINGQRRAPGSTEQTAGFFPNEQTHASSSEAGGAAHRSPGFPSTSGSDTETSEDEVLRLLNCNDHYTALGLSRFQDVDISALKREYRKKAMLVHPDKNMSNPKAAEAFQKLQNAYEILLDTYKRKSYDDELRREELLNYFSWLQETSGRNGRNGFFTSGLGREHADDEETLAESRRIACKKCGNFHIWIYTKKMKSRARWCQECKDYHPAKDGDGWVEQLSHPVVFGLLQKTDPPAAYICANSKIYNATEWYMCQGMRCAANTHKPSFHVNMNVTWKQSSSNNGKGGNPTGQKTGGGGTGPPNLDETMTEEEFFEWLQNAVQTGMFDNMSANHSDAANPFTGSTGSTSNGSGGSGSNPKRKKKGKR